MTIETKSVAEVAAETKAAFDKAVGDVRAIAEDALGKAKHGESERSQGPHGRNRAEDCPQG